MLPPVTVAMKNAILIFCVLEFWYIIIEEFMSHGANDTPVPAITLTVLTVYVWHKIVK